MRRSALVILTAFALAFALAVWPGSQEPDGGGGAEEGFLEVEGGRLHFQTAGSGPAVVLLPDGLVDLRGWDGVWEALAAEFRVVRYDRRGSGTSPAAAEPHVSRDDLRRVLDHLEIPVATLVASSSGGDLALRTAFAYPSRVERLVLIGPVVSGLGLSGRSRAQSAFGHLNEILVPTLVVAGEGASPDVHANAGAIQAGVREARREVIAGTGHSVALEDPEALLEVVLPFLRRPVVSESTIDFRTSPCLSLYFHVRSLAVAKAEAEGGAAFQPAVEIARSLGEKLGGGNLDWGSLDERVRHCRTAAELPELLASLPEPLRLFGGREVSAREDAIALGKALAAAEETYLEEVWPRQEPRIRQAVSGLEEDLSPHLPRALAYHLRSLGVPDPGIEIPAYFVHDIPWPGAVTHAWQEGGVGSFLGVDRFAPDTLLETVLHETTHAFVSSTWGSGHLNEVLRDRLIEAGGLSFRDSRLRDIPHTLMFVQSGETVRRLLDPEHVHYGVQETYYERIPLAREEVSIWVDHLDGAISREQALDRLVGLAAEPVE